MCSRPAYARPCATDLCNPRPSPRMRRPSITGRAGTLSPRGPVVHRTQSIGGLCRECRDPGGKRAATGWHAISWTCTCTAVSICVSQWGLEPESRVDMHRSPPSAAAGSSSLCPRRADATTAYRYPRVFWSRLIYTTPGRRKTPKADNSCSGSAVNGLHPVRARRAKGPGT